MTQHSKTIFGFILLGLWGILIAMIAIGHVEEATSYGLMPALTALTSISTTWANSVFGVTSNGKNDSETKEPKG